MGKNSSYIQVPFLNLMATLANRGGEVHVRVGGNTQDYATLVDHLDKGNVIQKMPDNVGNPTGTPPLLFTRDLLYMMNNISNFVPVKWYLGQYLSPDSFFLPALYAWFLARNLTYTVPHRRSAQRYIKLAIADSHGGREDPWQQYTRLPSGERTGSLCPTPTSSSHLHTSRLC